MSSIQNVIQLNLARKWRSAHFEEIIGQDLSIKILKNSLYLNSFFPVYLFSGNRGCGKTTTARVFAAAINCAALPNFQREPAKHPVPCRQCPSCIAFTTGSHPDFIEIDAASNTGVDNVRQIIESSTFLPLMGRKKIYLIDEAHMLSKAAFNAFLKVLEEPPAGVLFILATTDIQKIIDTVRSRSFQLFFGQIERDTLVDHLASICQSEQIAYERDGLTIIAREAEGSARDAINLLERVRFSCSTVSQTTVLNALGHMSDERLIQIIKILCTPGTVDELIRLLEKINFNTFSPEFIWRRLLELISAALRIQSNVAINLPESSQETLKEILDQLSRAQVLRVLDAVCASEQIFLKTRTKHLFLETLFVRIVAGLNLEKAPITSSGNQQGNINVSKKPITTERVVTQNNIQTQKQGNVAPQAALTKEVKPIQVPSASTTQEVAHNVKEHIQDKNDNDGWQRFIARIETLEDPLVKSVFSQGLLKTYNTDEQTLSVSFPKKFVFFKDLLADTHSPWKKLLVEIFGAHIRLLVSFDENDILLKQPPEHIAHKESTSLPATHTSAVIQSNSLAPTGASGNTSNKTIGNALGEKSQLLLRYFPGRITVSSEVL